MALKICFKYFEHSVFQTETLVYEGIPYSFETTSLPIIAEEF